MTKKIENPTEYFLIHYEVLPNGCWLWTGNIAPNGYGRLRVNGKYEYAHRFSYKHFNGEIPEGLQLDHRCRNRACVNPENIEPVTLAENIKRGYKSRLGNRTHCSRGHLLAPPPRENEQCHECKVGRSKVFTAKKTMLHAIKAASLGPLCPECLGEHKRPSGHTGHHTKAPDQLQPRSKGNITVSCLQCGRVFSSFQCQMKKYCSLKCAYASPARVANNPQNNSGWKQVRQTGPSRLGIEITPAWAVKLEKVGVSK